MSDIVVNVTNAGAANVSVSSPATVNTTVGNGGSVNVSLGTVSPGNATVVSGTVTINSTTTLAPGSNATVTNNGTAYAAVLDFGIPAGAAGPQGPAGQNGTNGVTPTFTASALTLAAGSSATVTATPSNGGANVALEFGIPRGDPGTGGGSNLTLSDGTPSALGTASAGTSNLASRADHVHNLPVIAYGNLSGVPSNFPSNLTLVTGLQAALDGKQAAGNYVTSVNNLTGGLTLAPGANVTITPSGSTLTIDATLSGVGANDVIDGGTYVGEILYGITFSLQPQSQTVGSSLTANMSAVSVSDNQPSTSVFSANSRLYSPRKFNASSGASMVSSQDSGSTWQATGPQGLTLANSFSSSFHDVALLASNGTRTLFRYSSHDGTSGSFGPLHFSDNADLSSATAVTGDVASAGLAVWNGSRFIAATVDEYRWNLFSSSDGTSWTKRISVEDGTLTFDVRWMAVLGSIVLVGQGSNDSSGFVGAPNGGVMRSDDGISWSTVAVSGTKPLSVASSGTRLVGVNGTTARWTLNGTVWNASTLPVSCDRVSYAAGVFWAFRSSQQTTDVCYSADGSQWTLGTMPASRKWLAAASAGGAPFFLADDGYATATISTSPASANLTVSATAASGNPVSYQWQSSLDAGTSWSNVANATNAALNLTGLTQADNGTQYRAIASATGATPATSQSATLTVTGDSIGGGGSGGSSNVAAGSLFSWGLNGDGQIGDGTTTNRLSPVQVGSLTWSAVAGGGSHTLAIRTGGTLYTWGSNLYGELGDGGAARLTPSQVGTSTWSSVTAGAYSSYGIRSDGKLFAWGNNPEGRLGDGTTTDRAAPVQIGTDSWSAIDANYQHVAAIRADGKLFTWGGNFYGQLGDGTTTSRSSPTQIGTDSWSAVAVGWYHTAAIRADGKLFAWGSNSSGAVGDGTTTNRVTPVQIGTDSWLAVTAGEHRTYAIKSDGTLWAWGSNIAGSLGYGEMSSDQVPGSAQKNSPVQIGTDSWLAVSSGWRTTIGVRSDGKLFTWGYNGPQGTIGDGTTNYAIAPTQIGTASWSAAAMANATAYGIRS